MKWYSIMDYKIPLNLEYIFVALKIDELCTYKMARYGYDVITDRFAWFDENGNKFTQVTHFCIPEPIENEDKV